MGNPLAVAASVIHRRASGGGAAASVYGGAAGGRLHYDWTMNRLSADRALAGSLGVLRDRARELVINNTTASRVPQLFSENVDGQHGILYQATVKTLDGEFDAAANAELESAWYRWCESSAASTDRRLLWPEVGALMTEAEVTDGEVLLRLVRGFDNPFGFAVELLDPDQLDHTFHRLPAPGLNEIRMGVEVDAWGGAVAYHVWSNHPSEGIRRTRIRVPAAEIIHLYLARRPRQTRGVTWFAPAIVDLKMHGGYREAVLVGMRAATSKMGFLQFDETKGQYQDDSDEAYEEDGTLPMDAAPATIERLPPGWSFSAWDPTSPPTSFQEFDSAILHSLATGLRVSYMSISGDLQGTSYGSGRIGLLAERSVYQMLQQRRIRRVESPVFRVWLEMALLKGAVRLSSYDAERYTAAAWHPRSFPWIDPDKDITAALKEVGAGLNSLTRVCAERGRDFEEVLQERARETELAARYGVTLELNPGKGAPPAPAAADANGDAASPDASPSPDARHARRAPPVRLLASSRGR